MALRRRGPLVTTASPTRQRFAVFAHFDPDGEVAPHVRRAIVALAEFAQRLVVVSTAPLTAGSREWLRTQAELVERANSGHDFASYRAGLELFDGDADQLILMNDSAVVPLWSLTGIFAEMDSRHRDMWGLTPGYGFDRHIQSYFLVFERPAFESPVFREFWVSMPDTISRTEVIVGHEVGLSTIMRSAGFQLDTYFLPTIRDLIRGAARAHAAELDGAWRERRWRNVAGWYRRFPGRVRHPEWNPAVALADTALRRPHVLPAIKLSTLRDDAYHLGAPALLGALERHQPKHFVGVEDYLNRTDIAYGGRWAVTVNSRSDRAHYNTHSPNGIRVSGRASG